MGLFKQELILCPFSTAYYRSSFQYLFTIQHTRYTNDCLKLGPPTFYGKGPHQSLRVGSGATRGQITISGITNSQKYYVIFTIYTYFANVVAGLIIQAGRPQVGYQRSKGKWHSTLLHTKFSLIISCWFGKLLHLLCENTAWESLHIATVYLGA
jgi:hypothetical protein